MTSPTDLLDRGMARFMLCFPVHLDPILHRTRYGGRDFLQSEIMVITALAARGTLSPTRISHMLNMQKGSLSSVLRRLEKLGLISRRRNHSDDRSYGVRLTPEGDNFASHLAKQRRRELASLFSEMPSEDLATATAGLTSIVAYLEKLEERTMADVKMTPKSPQHWYYAATDEDRREYDAYGPWVVEVTREEDMPPRFRPFYDEDSAANILLKFPRKEERRELRPGMDLYREIMALHETGLVRRYLEDGRIVRQDIDWPQIVGIGCGSDLLAGRWSIYLDDGARLDIRYNKVSADVMNKATDFVRAHIGGEVARHVEPTEAIEIPASEVFFNSVLLEIERREPQPVIPLHFDPEDVPLAGAQPGIRLATGLMILETPCDLVIVSRDKELREQDEASFAWNDLFLPFDKMSGYALGAASGSDAQPFRMLSLFLEDQVIRQPCLTVPEHVIAALRARSVPNVPER